MKQGYNTRQKEYIMEYLRRNADRHASVNDIVDYLRSTGREVGTATVYRCLDRLSQSGEVRKYLIDGGGACYQYIPDGAECAEHFHLKCVRCGELIHVDCDFLSEIGEHIRGHHRFRIDRSKTVFYGTCIRCAEAEAIDGKEEKGDSAFRACGEKCGCGEKNTYDPKKLQNI